MRAPRTTIPWLGLADLVQRHGVAGERAGPSPGRSSGGRSCGSARGRRGPAASGRRRGWSAPSALRPSAPAQRRARRRSRRTSRSCSRACGPSGRRCSRRCAPARGGAAAGPPCERGIMWLTLIGSPGLGVGHQAVVGELVLPVEHVGQGLGRAGAGRDASVTSSTRSSPSHSSAVRAAQPLQELLAGAGARHRSARSLARWIASTNAPRHLDRGAGVVVRSAGSRCGRRAPRPAPGTRSS